MENAQPFQNLEPVKIKGKFGVIYADPPWEYGNPFCSPRLKAEQRYPTMKLAEIKAMRADIDEVALEESVCFLWATNAFFAIWSPSSFCLGF